MASPEPALSRHDEIVTEWSLALLTEGAALPDGTIDAGWVGSQDWSPVSVPSTVVTSSHGMPLETLYVGENVREVQWMARRHWAYRTSIRVPTVPDAHEAVLILEGLDYRGSVFVDGAALARHEGMFSPIEIDMEPGEHEVVVMVEPFLEDGAPPAHLKARYSVEPYDFNAPFVSLGIWRDVRLVVRPLLRVLSTSVRTSLVNDDRAEVDVLVRLSDEIEEGWVTVDLDGTTRRFPVVAARDLVLPVTVRSPRLWWPNGHGAAELSELRIDIEVEGRTTESYVRSVGLRSVERRAAAGQRPGDFPQQLVINGRDVFVKGVNWVPLDSAPGTITDERYRPFLAEFARGGVNLVRVWGGGLRERDAFYDLADELGLMVLHDFPLSIRRPARTAAFYRLVAQEISAIVTGLSHHPCIVGWTGGNELYTEWQRVDSGTDRMREVAEEVAIWIRDDRELMGPPLDPTPWRLGADRYHEPVLSLMAQLVGTLDGSRPFQLTSAMDGEGDAHGTWSWNPRVGDQRYREYDSLYDYWRDAPENMYSEASVSSIANLETIREVFDGSPTPPTYDDPVWRFHKAFGAAWNSLDDLWLDLSSTRELFGELADLEDLVLANQWMQGEGGRFAIEELRRKAPRTTGFIWWGANEPWPGLAGNALIDYRARPKVSWKFIVGAYRPVILSLRYQHCIVRAAAPELWISSDRPGDVRGEYSVVIVDPDSGEETTMRGRVDARGGASRQLVELPRFVLASEQSRHVRLRLECEDGYEHVNDYVFASAEDEAPLARRLELLRRLFGEGSAP